MRSVIHSRKLRFEPLENRRVLSITPLANGQEVTREVGQEDPYDDFSFYAQEGQQIWVSVGEQRAKASSTVELDVYTPEGYRYNDWGYNNAIESFTATATGTYYARVRESGNEQDFDYKIRVLTLPGELTYSYSQDATLSNGEEHYGRLDIGELAVVQFDAVQGSSVFVTYGEVGNFAASPTMKIVDPQGSTVTSGWTSTGLSRNFTANRTGTYYAVLSDYYAASPFNFRFTLATLPGELNYSLPQNTYLESGQRHSGSVAVGEQHFVQFHATQGEHFIATLGEQTLVDAPGTPRLVILDPSGRVYSNSWGYQGVGGTVIAPRTGLYTAILSESNSDVAMDYQFRVLTLPISQATHRELELPLQEGGVQSGTVHAGDFMVHPFKVDDGEMGTIELNEAPNPTSAYIHLQIYNAEGTRLFYNWDYDQKTAQVAGDSSTTFYAIVSSSSYISSLDYELSGTGLTAIASPPLGDYNRNFTVDGNDFLAWQSSFNRTQGSGMAADGNNNGVVDAPDLEIWETTYGAVAVQSATGNANRYVALAIATHQKAPATETARDLAFADYQETNEESSARISNRAFHQRVSNKAEAQVNLKEESSNHPSKEGSHRLSDWSEASQPLFPGLV